MIGTGNCWPAATVLWIPAYRVSTINGRVLGFGEPLRVKTGPAGSSADPEFQPNRSALDRSRRTSFKVIALDGNPVPRPQTVPMLRLAPAERVSAIVEMNAPGVWVMGEVRKHIMSAGMGIVVEYAGYSRKATVAAAQRNFCGIICTFAAAAQSMQQPTEGAITVPLVFESKFAGHGAMDRWTINGKSYPETVRSRAQSWPTLSSGFSSITAPTIIPYTCTGTALNCAAARSSGDPRHRERYRVGRCQDPARSRVHRQMIPGPTLFHCHQQNHMDAGFMMLLHYA